MGNEPRPLVLEFRFSYVHLANPHGKIALPLEMNDEVDEESLTVVV